MMDLRKVSDEVLGAKLLELVSKERSLLCMIIICVMEIARRKSYLNTHSDLFSYLTDLLKYSHGSAQRRKDAALLALEIPSILEDVKSGSLNLSQITLAQSAFRLCERLKKKASKEGDFKVPTELKKQILTAIKDRSVADSEVIIYSMLNIKPKSRTKLTHQSDGSVRCETTHSKLQWEKIERTKELLSHSVPTGEITDLMEYLCDRVIAFKDKTVTKQSRKQSSTKENTRETNGNGNGNGNTIHEASVNDKHKSSDPKNSKIPTGIRKGANVGRSVGAKSDGLKKASDNSISNFANLGPSSECVTFSKLENLASKIEDSIQSGAISKSVAEIRGGIGPGTSENLPDDISNFDANSKMLSSIASKSDSAIPDGTSNNSRGKIPEGIALCPSPTRFLEPKSRAAVRAAVQRQIFARDKCCQHISSEGKPCGSHWQLQIDHIQPVWAGGGNEVENLRLLCGAHNRAAYRRQTGVIAG